MASLAKLLFRKKRTEYSLGSGSELSKCLSTWDLTSLGIGATLGAGTYVVSGQVAASIAGPAVIISFAIAAFASILSGLCYAEFGARVPKTTGSAYAYSYYTVGEIWAFFIGWNLILEYMIGTAADARALSGCFDFVIGYALRNFTLDNIGGFHTVGLGTYPDFLGFAVTVVVTIVLAIGVKQSSTFTGIFNVLNILVVTFIIACGLFFVDIKNWTSGRGFFPYGGSGVLSGAATCFYAFVGFDIIATTGEEAKNATKSIPKAIVGSLVVVFLCYFGVSAVLTLMVRFDQLDKLTPIPNAFAQRGIPAAKYIIGVGAVCGLAASLLGSLFPLPRIIYAMASDGLLFRFLAKVNPKSEVPVIATIYPGVLTAVFALLFDLQELVEMMSIGTLLAYTLVSLCVLILRYQPDEESVPEDLSSFVYLNGHLTLSDDGDETMDEFDYELVQEGEKLLAKSPDMNGHAKLTSSPYIKNPDKGPEKKRKKRASLYDNLPTAQSGRLVTCAVMSLFLWFFGFCSFIIYGIDEIFRYNIPIIALTVLFGVLGIVSIGLIASQPQNPRKIEFMAPLVPGLPIMAIFFNIFLMLKLSRLTWVRFGIWMGLGTLLYFGYGIWHSKEGIRRNGSSSASKLLLSETLDDLDIAYDMEIIPAHREDWEKDSLEDETFDAI
ncbi:probable cationic amino acid transporter [Nematostella vectensis]|uniref:probable cationic amino acid transporter n=1 Tax=Nematostella vectensis TaxID=45351 RepID=UPI0020779455|nr:probable cationic amino acid transporter [Nematostella vectensis]